LRIALSIGLGVVILGCGGVDLSKEDRTLFTADDALVTYKEGLPVSQDNTRFFSDATRWEPGLSAVGVDLGEGSFFMSDWGRSVGTEQSFTWCGEGSIDYDSPFAACIEMRPDCSMGTTYRSEALPRMDRDAWYMTEPTARGRIIRYRYVESSYVDGVHSPAAIVAWQLRVGEEWVDLELEPTPSRLDETDDYWVGLAEGAPMAWDREGRVVARLDVEALTLRPAPSGNTALVVTKEEVWLWTPGAEPTRAFEPMPDVFEGKPERFRAGAWRPDGEAIVVWSNRSGVWVVPYMANSPHFDYHPFAVDLQTKRVARIHSKKENGPWVDTVWVPAWVATCGRELFVEDEKRRRNR